MTEIILPIVITGALLTGMVSIGYLLSLITPPETDNNQQPVILQDIGLKWNKEDSYSNRSDMKITCSHITKLPG